MGKLTSRSPAGRTAENFLPNDFTTERQQLEQLCRNRNVVNRWWTAVISSLPSFFDKNFTEFYRIWEIKFPKRDHLPRRERERAGLEFDRLVWNIRDESSSLVYANNSALRMIYRNRDKKFMTSRCDKELGGGCKRVVVYPSFAQNRTLQSLPSSWQNASTKITLYYPATMPPEPLKAPLPTRS